MPKFADMLSSKIRRSPIILIVFCALVAAFVISCMLAYEDYWTSRLGYEAFPTTKVNLWIIPWVALLPQVVQIISFFFGVEKGSKELLSVFVVGAVFDCATDVYFKSIGHGTTGLLVAIPETLVLYTFGSELLMTFSAAMIIENMPDFIEQFKIAVSKIFGALLPGDGQPERPSGAGEHGRGFLPHNVPDNQRPENSRRGEPEVPRGRSGPTRQIHG